MMKNSSAKQIALGGMLAAAALVIMCLCGLIPLATFVCPMLCILVLSVVVRLCGRRLGWAWYAAVAALSVLLAPDKEAAAVFACLGYYPMLKPKLDRIRLGWLWKLLLFNGVTALLYGLLLRLTGMDAVSEEYQQLGMIGTIILLVLGNLTFLLLDRLLGILAKRMYRK